MAIIHAIYENGVFRPKEPVDLPESSEVEVELRSVAPPTDDKRLDAIYAILESRFESGREPGDLRRQSDHPGDADLRRADPEPPRAGVSTEEILADHPELESKDILACIACAR